LNCQGFGGRHGFIVECVAIDDSDWVPTACTLPIAERPVRLGEFDTLFNAVQRWARPRPTQLDLMIRRDAESKGRDLAERESYCCSFFAIQFEQVDAGVAMRISVPVAYVGVLDALEARLASAVGAN
jgi:hypothetical protein